jgi:ActR/RegA family two-component response regulator
MRSDDVRFERRRILIVEDDYFIASEVARAFQLRGADVIGPAPTLSTAVRMVENDQAIELAVLDINLRGEMVYPLAAILADKGVPFVFATGYDTDTVPDRFRHVPLLTKPTTFIDIATELARIEGGTASAAGATGHRLSFRVAPRDGGWSWEVIDPDGERIASGSSASSESARADVYRMLLRDRSDGH